MVPLSRAGVAVRIGAVVLAAMLLAACDKCGDSIFRPGPSVCKDQKPRQ
jgi:hypothetical protein